MRSVPQRVIYILVFFAALATVDKLWKPECLLAGKQKKKMGHTYTHIHTHLHTHTYTMEYYSTFKNKEILPFSQFKWNRGHYAKWNKPERQIWHDLIYIWNLKYLNSQKQKVEWWLPGVGKMGRWVEFHLCRMSKFWRYDV